MHSYRNTFGLFIGLFVISTANQTIRGEDLNLDSLQSQILETIDQVRPAVVNITSRGSGFSGVIVSPDGHVLSAAHAVKPGAVYRLTLPDGRRLRGIGKGSNPRADCALIQITNPGKDLPYAPMGDSASLVRNQPCIGLSYPGGQKSGREPIARFGRVVRNSTTRGVIQSSALMEPGDSGGPLFDLNGYVVGIHSRIGQQMNRNYEVPVNLYRTFWNELNREQEFVQIGPPTPRLGVRVEEARDEEDKDKIIGLKINSVVEDSLASKADIKPGDILLEFYKSKPQAVTELRESLIAARDEGAETITAKVRRGEDEIELEVDFDVEREAAPEVALPDDDHPSVPAPVGYDEMERLAGYLDELESSLDDACVELTSKTSAVYSRSIVGTRVKGTPWIISKGSMVGDSPQIKAEESPVELSVVRRDDENDLVLLEAPEVNASGIELNAEAAKIITGTFLLTPDEDGAGFVSVIGSPAFESDRFRSRGFLGVVPSTYKDNKGAVLNEVSKDGAANKAGLLAGDIITKLNDTIIRTHSDMRSFLLKSAPDAVITATLRRDEDELTKSITLGSVPSTSRHAADQMPKSTRRDGFDLVITHDADLKPRDCGGPIFDLQGNLVGLNIARNSRIRSYAVPASVVQAFVEQSTTEEESE